MILTLVTGHIGSGTSDLASRTGNRDSGAAKSGIGKRAPGFEPGTGHCEQHTWNSELKKKKKITALSVDSSP